MEVLLITYQLLINSKPDIIAVELILVLLCGILKSITNFACTIAFCNVKFSKLLMQVPNSKFFQSSCTFCVLAPVLQ